MFIQQILLCICFIEASPFLSLSLSLSIAISSMNRKMSILRVICCNLILMMMVGCPPSTGADFAQDKKECQDKLVGLRSCLGYISGEEKSPPSSCCLQLSESYNKSRRCLCLLVRDRNEPDLGFKLNATLTLTLPFVCHIPANETECIDLLKLDPHSPDAQIFQQPANTTATAGGADSSSSSVTGMHARRRFQFQMIGGIWVWLLMSNFFTSCL